jgi:disulfide bond formation protein DsbB
VASTSSSEEGLLEALITGWPVYLALIAAWTAMLGSLYFSEVRHFTPCEMCWFQRIFMYPLAFVVAVGILRRDKVLPAYVIPLSLIGSAFSVYHLLLQNGYFTKVKACGGEVPCTLRYIGWLQGHVTIPVLALTAFLLILLGMSAARRDADETWASPGPAPWIPVAVSIGAVFAFFGAVLAMR